MNTNGNTIIVSYHLMKNWLFMNYMLVIFLVEKMVQMLVERLKMLQKKLNI
jgi:hypothetical protein